MKEVFTCKKPSNTLTPKKWLLLKLTCNPEISSKLLKIAFRDYKFSWIGSPNTIKSSAYCKREKSNSSPRETPLKIPFSEALLKRPAKPSAIVKNRKGVMGSACLSPRLVITSLVGLPLTRIEILVEATQAFNQDLHLTLKPSPDNI